MRYLITGGCGFLGSNLASEVLRRGEELCLLDNLHRVGSSQNLAWLNRQGSLKHFQDDIRDQARVLDVVREFKPDVVFHLAGQVAMTTSIRDPRMDFQVNALGTLNLLEAVRDARPEAVIVYSSTNKVYGDLEQYDYQETPTRYSCVQAPEGFDERVPLEFHSPYGCSKGSADQYMLDFARVFGLRTIVFRHSSIFGGRQFSTEDQGWVGWFTQKALERREGHGGEPFTISGNGKQVRDVLFVDDLIACYFGASEKSERVFGEAFNIGGGMANSLSLLELFEWLERTLGVTMEFRKLPRRCSDQKVFVANCSKAERGFGWVPRIPKEDGLSRMVDWAGETLLG